ncbi:restriction endonuclease subunit S [Intestinibacillus sp. Marseille-P6563]|uniref:restriction endonuclease subunit S n=1 Tax=Intestinibacillus sp. Marseille-P6563 TaxID=2364792 RepID=UPI000F056E9C|nr:restriction endonuclease subunit S [Intestinibacillus sp. Marseille-P6563]
MKCETYSLGDVCTFIDYRGKTPPKTTSGIPLVTAKIVKNGMIQEPQEFIAENYYDEWMRRGIPKKGSVVFTTEAPLGEVARIRTDDKLAFAQRIIVLEPKTKQLSADYLFYALQDRVLKSRIEARSTGTTVIGIKAAELKKVEIDLPSLEEQEKIAAILCSLDDKIELNNKINENLERQAVTLFDNFYNRTDSSVKFTEIIQIMGGGTPKTGESSYWNGQIPFFTPKDVGSPYTLTTEKWITEEGLSHCNSRLYPVNTVFVTARGTVGKVGMPGVPMAMNQSCYALIGKEIHQLLVYFYTLKTVDRLKHKASGAVFDAITTRDFESESISKVSDDDAEAFLSIAEPIYQAILSNVMENQRLAILRDILLPKLMSGELSV